MYRVRPIRFMRYWAHQSWRMKLYSISAWDKSPTPALVTAAEQIAARVLPPDAAAEGRHGVGFIGVHDGAQANYVFVSWWAKLYELNHVLYRGSRDKPSELAPVEPGLFGCTWDLQIIAFERDAWIRSMLGDNGNPEIDRYMAATFQADV
jgi:hypothetical protein